MCLMPTLEKCLILTYYLRISTRVQIKKKPGDMPLASLKFEITLKMIHAFPLYDSLFGNCFETFFI